MRVMLIFAGLAVLGCQSPQEGANVARIPLGAKLEDYPHGPLEPATTELFVALISFSKATPELRCCDQRAVQSHEAGTESCAPTHINRPPSAACTALAARLRLSELRAPYVNERCFVHGTTKWTKAVVDEQGTIVGLRTFCGI